jgi:hypothetical protein
VTATADPGTPVRITDLSYPIDTLRDAAIELRRPFAVKALQWKVQTQWTDKDGKPTGGMIVCYIDRALVVDRLNVVVPHLWSHRFTDLERNHTLCWLTVGAITREDVGEGSTLKARRSDALKRAAVHFGVGVSLARIPKSRLQVESGQLRARSYRSRGEDKWVLEISQLGLDYLRSRYQGWLEQIGADTFGEPFDHGDIGDAQGDDEAADLTLADAETKVELYTRLVDRTTLRQQRGYLSAAGVPDLPQAPTAQDIERAVDALTDEAAEKLDTLLATKAGGGDEQH